MRKAFTLFVSLVLVILLSACWDNTDADVIDVCRDKVDCYILSNEDVKVIAELRDDEYLEMSNKELEQVNEITTSYFFNYFEEDSSTLSNERKRNLLSTFDQFDTLIDYDHFSESLYFFMSFQWKLIDFEIDTLSESNLQYLEIANREHVIYKSDINIITYLIRFNGDIDEYDFNLTTNTISSINHIKNFNTIQNDFTQYEGVIFTENYFSYVYLEELTENVVIEKDISFMDKHGFYGFSATAFNGGLVSKRTYPLDTGNLEVVTTSFNVSYNEVTSLFDFYNNFDQSYTHVSYSDFFKTAFNHPNLDVEIIAWCNQAFTESELIELFTPTEDTTN